MADQSGDCKSYLQIKSKHILFTKELARIEKKIQKSQDFSVRGLRQIHTHKNNLHNQIY